VVWPKLPPQAGEGGKTDTMSGIDGMRQSSTVHLGQSEATQARVGQGHTSYGDHASHGARCANGTTVHARITRRINVTP